MRTSLVELLETPRLKLLPFTLELKQVTLSERARLPELLGVAVPDAWPGIRNCYSEQLRQSGSLGERDLLEFQREREQLEPWRFQEFHQRCPHFRDSFVAFPTGDVSSS